MHDESVKSGEGFVVKDSPQKNSDRTDSVDFATFIFSIATGAFIGLGLTPDPSTGKTEKNIPMARQNIELLVLLREKTKGNLSTDETKLLEGLLAEAQMSFVKETSSKS
jgi:hypothetical protein